MRAIVSAGHRHTRAGHGASRPGGRCSRATRVWRPVWPCPVGPGARHPPPRGRATRPSARTPDGAIWRGIRTPEGPATLRIAHRRRRGGVVTAARLGQRRRLGARPAAADARRRRRPDRASRRSTGRSPTPGAATRTGGWGATDLVMESLVPAIIEQKVTGQEAFAALPHAGAPLRRAGARTAERAGPPVRLWVQPTPEQLRAIPSWEWLRLPVDGARSRPDPARRPGGVVARAGRAARPPEEFDRRRPHAARHRRLDERRGAVPGARATPTRSASATTTSPANVGCVLTGEPVDDDGLAVLLEPYAGHRHRVQRLVELAGLAGPRRGPRMAPRTHLPRVKRHRADSPPAPPDRRARACPL